jgi:release factor glutamine methyltransferase
VCVASFCRECTFLTPLHAQKKKKNSQTELRWFLEDAVAGRAVGPDAGPPPPPLHPDAAPAWSALESEARAAAAAGETPTTAPQTVWLRSSLADLTARWTARLDARLPFQYAVGAAHWRDLVLAVGPGVLCPRPETEQLVDLALAAAAAEPGGGCLSDGGHWADVCTGSGAVAAGLVTAFRGAGLTPPSTVWAIDLCPTAAAWAATNVARLGLGGAVRVVTGDLLGGLPPGSPALRGILSNPPYIPRPQMAGLQAEVGRHEPALALDGGDDDGLVVLRRLCAAAPAALVPGGFLGMETAGHGQAERVAELLDGSGAWQDTAVVDDMFGVARFVTARRR